MMKYEIEKRDFGSTWINVIGKNAIVFGDAWIESNADYLNISSLDSYNSYITFAKSRDNTILVHCDWFSGNIEEFEKKYWKLSVTTNKLSYIHLL